MGERKHKMEMADRSDGVGRAYASRALLALALCLVVTLGVAGAQAADARGRSRPNQATITRCEPESVRVPTTEQASLCIYVEDVAGLYGADFELSFPGMLDIATVVDEDLLTPGIQILRNYTWVPAGWVVQFNYADNSGYIHYLTYGWNPAPEISGSGPVACMRFQPSAVGEFDITFTRHDLSDRSGFLIDNTAQTCRVTFYNPTSAVIGRFEAWPAPGAVNLEWETNSEIDNAGFNLYRSERENDGYIRVNSGLILSQDPGSSVGFVYNWRDGALRAGATYYYKLETVNVRGGTVLYGPVSATPADVPFRMYLPFVSR